MKKLLILILFTAAVGYSQRGSVPPNAILKNFEPFETPRTNCRPGTVYRIDENGIEFIVQDVKSIKSLTSDEGTLTGQMTFSKEEMLAILNLNFDLEYITAEVEIKKAGREYTEQTNVDLVLWENDKASEFLTDENSRYYLIRETISSKDVTYRFNKKTVDKLVTGKSSLTEKQSKDGEEIDFPYSVTKKFKNPKRVFYLQQKISADE